MSPQVGPTVIFVSSPLQLENAKSFLSDSQVSAPARYFVIRLSGMWHYDREIFHAARDLAGEEIIFLAPVGIFQDSHGGPYREHLKAFERSTLIRPPAGRWSMARLLACFQVLSRYFGHPFLWRRLGHLVLGHPFEIIPFLSMMARGSEVTVVDDGLSVLTTAAVRRARQGLPRRSFRDTLRAPAFWTRPLTHYTIFKDVDFSPIDAVVVNQTFSSQKLPIEVMHEECWILGSPEVEEAGLALEYYIGVLSRISQRAKSHGLEVEYIPHRREPEGKVARLVEDLALLSRPKLYSVEQRVSETKRCPALLVGFGSTALETLAQFVPSECQIWSVLIPAPDRKVIAKGANSPEVIWERHKKSARIQALKPQEIDDSIY